MSKQPSTVQTTQNSTQTVPQYVTDAQTALLGYGNSQLSPFVSSNPNYAVAGLNQDQLTGYDLSRQYAQGAFTNSPTMPSWNGTSSAPTMGAAANTYMPTSMGPAQGYMPTSTGYAQTYGASQVDGASIQALMNPYIQSVIDPAKAQLRQQHDATSAQIGAQSAAAGSYGGSREAIRQAQNDRSLGEQTSSLVGQLMSQGYGQAASLAQANAQARQSADAANTGAQNQFQLTDANALTAAQRYGADVTNNQRQFDASAMTAGNAANAAAQNSRDQYLASLGLQSRAQDMSATQLQNSMLNDEQARRLAAIQQILGIGNAQQTQLQNILNVPGMGLAKLQGITPTTIPVNTNSVGTAPNTQKSLLEQLMGAGVTLGAAALCDARLKTDIAPHGFNDNGRPLFSFRYAWEAADAPRTVGPMAQIEEAHDPESVAEFHGIKFVKVA